MSIQLLEKFKPVIPWFERHRRDCWLPSVEDGDGGPTASKFAGRPWLMDSEQWPACGQCGRQMALFLQLNLASVPEPIRHRVGDGLLQAFFCTDDDCIHGPEEGDPFTRTHLLRIIDPTQQAGSARPPSATSNPNSDIPERHIVRWQQVDDYPSMAEAEEMGLVHESLKDRVSCNDPPFSVPAKLEEFFTMPWARENEKLAGWPGWANISTAYPPCPQCSRPMDFMIFQFQ